MNGTNSRDASGCPGQVSPYERSPHEHAQAAAEAVRWLNHVTRDPGGYSWPSDVDDVIAELHVMAQRLPQAMEQAGRWLQSAVRAGQVGHDNGADPAATVADALADLDAAIGAAEDLAANLSLVHQATAHLTGIDPTDHTSDPDDGSADEEARS
jgi:hypothetical protein